MQAIGWGPLTADSTAGKLQLVSFQEAALVLDCLPAVISFPLRVDQAFEKMLNALGDSNVASVPLICIPTSRLMSTLESQQDPSPFLEWDNITIRRFCIFWP